MLKKIKENKYLIILMSVIVLVTFWKVGSYGFADWDESIYAQVSKNVLRGNWLTLKWGTGDLLWFHKPPLYFWISAIFYKIFGTSELSARLISALSGLGLSLLIYKFAEKLFDRRVALFALMLTLFNSLLLFQFRFATIDVFVLLLTTLAVYFFWLSQTEKRNLIYSFIFVGLATMTKGPVAASVVLCFVIYALITKQFIGYLKSKYLWCGIGAYLLIAVPWHYYMIAEHGWDFYSQYVLYHIIQRAKEPIEGHAGGMLYYPWVIFRNFPIVFGILGIFLVQKRELLKKNKELILLAILLIVQYISIDRVATKIDWYILPVFVPLQILIAYILSQLFGRKKLIDVMLYAFLAMTFIVILIMPYGRWREYKQQQDAKGCLLTYKALVPLDKQDLLASNFNLPNLTYYLDSVQINLVDLDSSYGSAIRQGDLVVDATQTDAKNFSIIYSNQTCRILKAK